MTARYLIGDVFDQLATLEDGSVDLVVTSPPFLALRSYLPADHPDKGREIGSESTPAEFLDVMFRFTAELRRVLAPHGSIAVELGDTYAGPQPPWRYTEAHSPDKPMATGEFINGKMGEGNITGRAGEGWPLAKSKTLIPELYRIGLAYGINPLTGQPSPAGRWLVRNVVTWCRPNPPVGALGDKWRPATSDVVVAGTSPKRYWDDLATRKPFSEKTHQSAVSDTNGARTRAEQGGLPRMGPQINTHSGAPLLDYWEIPPTGYKGAHYAVYPPELVKPLVKAMCPERVCRECGEPSRRMAGDVSYVDANGTPHEPQQWASGIDAGMAAHSLKPDGGITAVRLEGGWTDCGHDDWRPGLVLDPFAGSGTTLQVATGHGHDAIGIDLDSRNADLALERVGPFLLEVEQSAAVGQEGTPNRG